MIQYALLYWAILWSVSVPTLGVSASPGLEAGIQSDSTASNPEDVVGVALKSWSQFTSLGELAVLDEVFMLEGPQYGQLVGEAPSGEPRLTFKAEQTVLRSEGATSATVWAKVQVTREGYQPEIREWDFDLVLTEDGWRVWTVVSAPRPTETAPSSSAPPTTEPSQSARVEARERSAPIAASTPSTQNTGVRLPALSAWIIVITLAGVALAGYLAPRIDRRRER